MASPRVRRIDYFFHFSFLFSALIYGLYVGSSLQVLWVGYADLILPIRAAFLTALVSVPGATMLEIYLGYKGRRRFGIGRTNFAIVGLFAEIVIISYFFNGIWLFLWTQQMVIFPPFSPEVKAFATGGLFLTLFFFLDLQRYLRPASMGSKLQKSVTLLAMIYCLVFVPAMMVFLPVRAIFNYSAFLSSLIVLGLSLLEIFIARPTREATK